MSFKEYLKDICLTLFVGIICMVLVACVSVDTPATPCQQLEAKIAYVNKYSDQYTTEEKVRIYELGTKGLDICTTVSPIPDMYREYRLQQILKDIDKYLK